MRFTVITSDGLNIVFVDDVPTPGGAAKKVVEDGVLRAGRLLVRDEMGKDTVWDVSERRIVYAYEVRNDDL